MSPFVIGLDVGGANLKAANTNGQARSQSYELWKNPAGLAQALSRLLESWQRPDQYAVTMTGELCDCFESKFEGVLAILDAVGEVAGATPLRVWTNEGWFVDVKGARGNPLPCAAANWLATAAFAGRHHAPQGSALLVDIGSTTTDLIPLLDGRPIPRGRTDHDRLCFQELIYTGVRRTPICALISDGVAAEFFATMLDAYLLLGLFPERPTDCNTADGRPATQAKAHARIARMLCGDAESTTLEETTHLAERARDRQMAILNRAFMHFANMHGGSIETLLLCGEGEFLARQLLETRALIRHNCAISFNDLLGPEISQAACAHAVAVLAAEDC